MKKARDSNFSAFFDHLDDFAEIKEKGFKNLNG